MGYFDQFQNKGIPFMENAKQGKIQDHLGEALQIDDFGFINTQDYGRCAVIHFREYPSNFFFGNTYVTEMLDQVKADGMEGLLFASVIRFKEQTGKTSGRTYITFDVEEFTPNA